ncbi:MAG: DUF559 domain-containing protein [Micropepsaceae bacterium]
MGKYLRSRRLLQGMGFWLATKCYNFRFACGRGVCAHRCMPTQQAHTFARALRKQMTNAEVRLWTNLRNRKLDGARFRRQHPVGPYIVDFACLQHKFIVEVDGATHGSDDEVAHDERRRRFLEGDGWKVLRVHNEDVYKNLDLVLAHISANLK